MSDGKGEDPKASSSSNSTGGEKKSDPKRSSERAARRRRSKLLRQAWATGHIACLSFTILYVVTFGYFGIFFYLALFASFVSFLATCYTQVGPITPTKEFVQKALHRDDVQYLLFFPMVASFKTWGVLIAPAVMAACHILGLIRAAKQSSLLPAPLVNILRPHAEKYGDLVTQQSPVVLGQLEVFLLPILGLQAVMAVFSRPLLLVFAFFYLRWVQLRCTSNQYTAEAYQKLLMNFAGLKAKAMSLIGR